MSPLQGLGVRRVLPYQALQPSLGYDALTGLSEVRRVWSEMSPVRAKERSEGREPWYDPNRRNPQPCKGDIDPPAGQLARANAGTVAAGSA
jgi:hypothetical protein